MLGVDASGLEPARILSSSRRCPGLRATESLFFSWGHAFYSKPTPSPLMHLRTSN